MGEIRMGGWNFAPVGWAFCDGQQVPISEFDALFMLIGTTYGGDGQETFDLPNLQGCLPVHQGTNPSTGTPYVAGDYGGVEEATVTTNNMPAHSHMLLGSVDVATSNQPNNNVLASITPAGTQRAYRSVPLDLGAMSPSSISPAGGSQRHDNRQPYQCVNFVISLYGIFPSPS
jgi:microcystin-dependent protein